MTIAFPCEQCGNRFEVDRALAGKKCRCKKCGHVFLIPVPSESSVAPSSPKPKPELKTFNAPGSSSTTRPADKPAPRPKPAPESKPSFTPNLFDDIEDDPYAIGDDSGAQPRRGAALDDEFLTPRAVVRTATKKKKGKGSGFLAEGLPGWFWLAVLGTYALLFALSFVSTTMATIFLVVMGLTILSLYAVGAIGMIVVPFRESVVCGLLYLFLPFYGIYYLITRWDNMKRWFAIGISGAGLAVLMGLFLPAIAAARQAAERARQQQAGMIGGAAAGQPGGLLPPNAGGPPIPPPIAPPFQPAPRPNFGARINPPQPPANFAQAPPPNFNPPRAESKTIDDFLNDIKSNDNNRRRQALGKLARTPLDEAKRADVAQALEPILSEPDEWARRDAIKALAVWGGPENTPALTKALKDPDVFTRGEALATIKALHDPAAAEAVAALIPEHPTRGPALEALKAMGSKAEPALLPFLNHQDVFVRMEVCKALQTVGTEACVPGLYEIIRRTNNFGLDANAAREALQRLDPDGKLFRELRTKAAKEAKAARDARLKGKSGSSPRPAP